MACSKCKKKVQLKARTLLLPEEYVSSGEIAVDHNIYFVQATRDIMLNMGGEMLRFMPGELVNMIGTLLSAILIGDSSLFSFRLKSEKSSFFLLHPELGG